MLRLAFHGLLLPTLTLTGSSRCSDQMQEQMGVVAYGCFVESFCHSIPALFFGVVIWRWVNILVGSLRWTENALSSAYALNMLCAPLRNVSHLVILHFVLVASCAMWYVLLAM